MAGYSLCDHYRLAGYDENGTFTKRGSCDQARQERSAVIGHAEGAKEIEAKQIADGCGRAKLRFMKLLFFSLLASPSASPLSGRLRRLPPRQRPHRGVEYIDERGTRSRDRIPKADEKDFLARLKAFGSAWKFRRADKWSIAEAAEHIAVAEQTIWDLVLGKIMKAPPAPEKAAAAKGKDETILTVIPDRSRKAQAPERLQPTGRWTTRAELTKDFGAIRGKEIAYVTETKEDLRNHFEDHPFLKTMDAYQWIIFNGAHCKRHTAQILEAKAIRIIRKVKRPRSVQHEHVGIPVITERKRLPSPAVTPQALTGMEALGGIARSSAYLSNRRKSWTVSGEEEAPGIPWAAVSEETMFGYSG